MKLDDFCAIKRSCAITTRLDLKKLGMYEEKLITDQVILTDERAKHIIERRGQDFYDQYVSHIEEVIDAPDYIFEDKTSDTVLIAKPVTENEKVINIVLRLAVQGDNPTYKNSILTMIGMGRKRFRQYMNKCIKENKIIYKKG